MTRIDAIVAARSGSRGIYGKNTVTVGARPLIEYTLDAVLGAATIRSVYLSTDDAALLSRYSGDGRIRIIERPSELAGDRTSIKPVLRHAIGEMKGDRPDLVVLLLPTAPLRTSAHIDAAVKFALSLPSFDSVVSVSKIDMSPYGGLLLDGHGKARTVSPDADLYYRRQDRPSVYALNGAIFIIRPGRIDDLNDLLLSDNSYGFKMEDHDSIDIDTPYDVAVAEAAFKFREERFSPDARGGFNLQRLYVHDDPDMGIRRNVLDAAAYERHYARYEFFLKHIEPSDAVLDIACGSGYGSHILASKAASVHGVDADALTIDYALKHYAAKNVTFSVSKAESYRPAKRYDKIISVETIEHLEDPEQFLAIAASWLKPGGAIWLTCPLSEGPGAAEPNPFHVSEMTRKRLDGMMKKRFCDVAFFTLAGKDIFEVDTLANKATYVVAKGRIG